MFGRWKKSLDYFPKAFKVQQLWLRLNLNAVEWKGENQNAENESVELREGESLSR
jgi:hypothetical protein